MAATKENSIHSALPIEVDSNSDYPQKPPILSKDVDIGLAYANALDGPGAYTDAEERALRWKLDRRIIVIMWLLNTLKAIDKVTTSTGVLYGMKKSTGLTGNKYSWVGSSFYFGYLIWCFPAAGLLQKLPIAKFIATGVGIWGIVLICTGFSNNFPTLVALRVLLGALEAPVLPGTFLMMNMWYTRREQTLRTGFMVTGLSVLFTGPVGWAIGFMSGPNVWRTFFWITGGITVLFSFLVGALIPDNPITAKFITERQKAIAVDRIRADQGGIENKTFKREQMIECFLDPKTWLSVLFQFFISIPNGGLTNFSPLIINGLGYSSQNSTLIMMPTGIVQTAASWLMSGIVFWAAGKYPKKNIRCIVMICGQIVGMISSIFLYTLPLGALKSRLAALYMSYFYLGAYALSLGLNATNTVGHTKKVTFGALIFITYCLSNIVAPQFFKTEQAPLYPLGIAAILGSYILSLITISLYAAYCAWENRRRDCVDDAIGERVHLDTDFKDLTDRQNVHFRYAW